MVVLSLEVYMRIFMYATHPVTPNEEFHEVSNAMLHRLGYAGKTPCEKLK
jgi:hypothetical protein